MGTPHTPREADSNTVGSGYHGLHENSATVYVGYVVANNIVTLTITEDFGGTLENLS